MSVEIVLVPTTVTIGPDSAARVTADGDAVGLVETPGPSTTVTATIELATLIRETEPPVTVVDTQDQVGVVSVGVPGPPGPQGPQGIQGPPGVSTAALAYKHDQQVPLAVWTIDHNLGFVPNVTVIDTLGETCWGEIVHPSVNQTILTFTAAFSGVAYLS